MHPSDAAPSAQFPPALTSFLKEHKVLGAALGRMLMLDRLNELYSRAALMRDKRLFFERVLDVLRVRPLVASGDLEQVPTSGSLIAVANHPFGFIEGCILAAVLPKIRPDVKIMANSLLASFPEVNGHFIYVNPFGGEEATRENQRGLRQAIAHVKNGGMLVVFPAGEVAHVNVRERAISDPPWSETIARIARMTNAPVLPIYFHGANSAMFQVLGTIHPRLRTAMLPHEFFNKSGRAIEVRIGSVVAPAKLASAASDEQRISYLRQRVYLLRHRDKHEAVSKRTASRENIIQASAGREMQSEIDALPLHRKLESSGDLSVFYATSREIPHILREIGRLREITFRAAGEGTGKSFDLDSFDAYYYQLFIWNSATREVIGAYRLGPTDIILALHKKEGLYTSTLFDLKETFLRKISPALEMGRSFVRVEYQKSYAPLLLLWRGIGAFVARNPKYKILFGPVSISNSYQPVSRQLMVTFFREQHGISELARFIKARSPFRTRPLKQWDDESARIREWDIEDLSASVADLELDQKGIPILLRQYLKLGGRLLGFNVDRHFSDALDGLIVVDLVQTDPKTLRRYMGKDGAESFLSWHGLTSAAKSKAVPA